MRQKTMLFLMFLLGMIGTTHAQTKVQGILIDSAYNKVLDAATVSIYEQGKKSVDQVSLTDRYGKFLIEKPTVGKPMYIEFSLQGYKKVKIDYHLAANESKDFGKINMVQVENEIEVVDLIPPVRMNGDTIEFNADAFQLDSNAVVEDLLHKLPGMVVWGDGEVTYNGRTVPTILVNGKPFFGSDMAIALQNIDKKAVDKLQVYDKRTREDKQKDPENKQMEMNVVLKEGKENMLFGSVGAGYGTDDRYQGNMNLNKSFGKSQATVAYSVNNINKNLSSVDQLLRNTTFKGIGVNADFESDFQRSGILNQHVVGARYQYDLSGKNQTNNQNTFQGNVNARWENNLQENESKTILLTSESTDHNSRASKSSSEYDSRHQNGNFSYFRTNYSTEAEKRSYSYNGNINLRNSHVESISNNLNLYDYLENQSSNSLENSNTRLSSDMDFNLRYNLNQKWKVMDGNGKRLNKTLDLIGFDFGLWGAVSSSKDENFVIGFYENITNPELDKESHRKYENSNNTKNLSGDMNLSYDKISLKQRLIYITSDVDQQVNELKDGTMIENGALTHISKSNKLEYEPALTYNTSLQNKYLNGRYSKNINLNLSMGARFFRDDQTSTLDYRNLLQNFTTFKPNISLNQSFSRMGKYYLSNGFSYNYNEEYPSLDRLRPIYDDINPGIRYYGAKYPLKVTGVHAFSLNGNYNEMKQYSARYNYNVNYRIYKDGLTDSLIYEGPEQQVFTSQVPQSQHLVSYYLSFSKPFLLKKDHTLTLNVSNNGSWGNKYQYVDDFMQEMINRNLSFQMNMNYTFLNKLQVAMKNNFGIYSRTDKKAENSNNDYTSKNWTLGLASAYMLTKRWTINTSLDNRTNFSKFQDNKALIWNVNMTYRMLKGNNLEVKVAALDLLKQNKGFYFYDSVTEFTTGTRNLLTQYYMVSLSYMPRKFGK